MGFSRLPSRTFVYRFLRIAFLNSALRTGPVAINHSEEDTKLADELGFFDLRL
jgi:hypothetical protein